MNVVWFWVLAAMLTAYAVLDGFDLGVGALHVWIARGDGERRVALNSIGPVWNGNEVWLIAAGGMLVASFPRVYAAGFSGFYLALMVVLWLLILRGVSIEFRGQFANPLWRAFWDGCFTVGSLLLALLLGVALGNVLRGLPIDERGQFSGSFGLLLNPYSLLTGILAVAVLAWHGANYLATKSEGALYARARRWSAVLLWAVIALVAASTAATFALRADLRPHFDRRPCFYAFPALALASLAAGVWARRGDRARAAFRASTSAIVGLLGAAAASVFPALLRSTIAPEYSLTVDNAASTPHALLSAFLANVVGMIAVVVYSVYVHRTFRGTVRIDDEHGY